MPRKVRDANLETRTARSKLKVRHKPYFRLIEPGLHLGYRRLASGPGTWIARRYVGDGKYEADNLRATDGRLIVADDFSDADEVAILSFGQAQEGAKLRVRAPTPCAGPYTVADAMRDYIAELEGRGRRTTDAKSHNRSFIDPWLGPTECDKLTTTQISDWLVDRAKQPARLRTGKGKKQQTRELRGDTESVRRRQATANRVFTTLRAALNRAWRAGKIRSDDEWRKVKTFEGVDAARVAYLQIAEAKRLINGCAPDFRKIVKGALVTGARFGQLAQTVASDFNRDSGTLRLRSRKGRGVEKEFYATLSEEGAAFFVEACAGVAPDDLIFRKANGHPWGPSEQKRPMASACAAAKIVPIGIHQLRHTWASHAVMNGIPLIVVARNLGHSDTRMVVKFYGHLAPSYEAKVIRESAPRFDLDFDRKVVTIT
jgi:integrase